MMDDQEITTCHCCISLDTTRSSVPLNLYSDVVSGRRAPEYAA